jgi:hypothetical protein
MALIPSTRYPAQIDTSDAGYPHGKARNAGSFQDGTGTPLEKDWLNDLFGFLQSLLDFASITPSGDPDEVGASQYLDAVDAVAVSHSLENAVIYNVESTELRFTKILRIQSGGSLIGAAGSIVDFDTVKVNTLTERTPERSVKVKEDFLGGSYDGAGNIVHSDHTWRTTSSGTVSASVNGGTPKNPGQLIISLGGGSTLNEFAFCLGATTATPVELDSIGTATMVVRVDDDAGNLATSFRFGFAANMGAANGAGNAVFVLYNPAFGADWFVYRNRGGTQAFLPTGVPYVSGEYITARFIQNASNGLDVEINGTVVTTIALANLPIGDGTFGAAMEGSPADAGASTVFVDLMAWQAPTLARSG